MCTLDQQKNIRKTAFLHQSLDDITRSLFANLRGGVNEEDELMKAAHTCPLCSSQLVPWFLGCFEEDRQQFERILWTCPKQETRQCYFPMNILPLEVFWTRRSLEQMSKGIIPLPNLRLLPKQYHHLYPKLLPVKKKYNKRKPENDLRFVYFLNYFYAITNILSRMDLEPQPSSSSLELGVPTSEAIPSSSTSSISYHSDTSVGAVLKDLHRQQLASTGNSRCSSLAVNTQMEQCRKLVDLNPNTSTALVFHFFPNQVYHPLMLVQKTHKILSDEHFGLDTEYVQNNTAIQHRRYIVDVPFSQPADISHENAINQKLSESSIDQKVGKRETRYISSIKNPSPIKTPIRKKENIQKPKLNKKDGIGESLNYREDERTRSLSARFGIMSTSRKKSANKRFEIHEGIIPQRSTSLYSHQPFEEDFALLDSQCQESNPKCTYSSISSSSIDCAESLATKNFDRDLKRKEFKKTARVMSTTSIEVQKRKEEERLVAIQTEENVRRRMELLLQTAFSRKNTKIDATTSATNVQNLSKKPSIEMNHFIDNQMELSGIPHDFQQDYIISTSTSCHQNLSGLTPINYENEGQNVEKFDLYDRCGTVMNIDNNDEFDFGFGLESEFINGGDNVADGNASILMNDESSFLEELSKR